MKERTKRYLSVILTLCLLLSLFAAGTSAALAAEPTGPEPAYTLAQDAVASGEEIGNKALAIDYNSGTEKKMVITGPMISLDSERVYTESELKEKFATDKVNGDYYVVSSINTVGTKRLYAVLGVSLWDVFADAGVGTDVYRNPDYFFQTVGADGMVQTIGPGVTFTGQGGVTEAGTLDVPRYNYPTASFYTNSEIDRVEIPWLIGFAENYNAVANPVTQPPPPPAVTDKNQALRPYVGQMNVGSMNNPFFNNCTYRLVFTDEQLSNANAVNNSAAPAFSLLGTLYDRATILTGFPSNGTNTDGEKVRGRYGADDGVVYFEGTSVQSLLPANAETIYFINAAGAAVSASLDEIIAGKYTLVYRTGASPDALNTIERTVNGKGYYFDLYRDGEPVVQNVSELSDTPGVVEPAVFTVTFVDFDGAVLDEQQVEEGQGAVAPEDPAREGYAFTGWDVEFGNITADLTVTALYEQNSEVTLVSATPSAYVTKFNGNENDLTITITELYSDGSANTLESTFRIGNNAADAYYVGAYGVYVDTKGNTQIRECRIVN